MQEYIIHTFEAGRRGKPDELEAGIAHRIGAYFLRKKPDSRFDLRVAGGYIGKPVVRVSGEISRSLFDFPTLREDISQIIVNHFNQVHRTSHSTRDFRLEYEFKPQADGLATNTEAGDSGNPIAVAYRTAPRYLPWERFIAVELRDLFDSIFQQGGKIPPAMREKTGIVDLRGLRADGKVDVDARYLGVEFQGLDHITLALEHEPAVEFLKLQEKVRALVLGYLALHQEQYKVHFHNPEIAFNGVGPWDRGGWGADEGSREAKSYRDMFGSYGTMEDSFSGEDPTKPSATGTFLARHIAVQIVARDWADFARVSLKYVIGSEEVRVNVTTQGTARKSQEELHAWVRECIPLRISDAITRFDLQNPQLYEDIVTASDFFHSEKFPWNKAEL